MCSVFIVYTLGTADPVLLQPGCRGSPRSSPRLARALLTRGAVCDALRYAAGSALDLPRSDMDGIYPASTVLSKRFTRLKWSAFVLTFLAYTSFHLSRKPASIVKDVLHPSSPSGESKYDPAVDPGYYPFNQDLVPSDVAKAGMSVGDDSGAGEELGGVFLCGTHNVTAKGVCRAFYKSDGSGGTYSLFRERHHDGNTDRCWTIAHLPKGATTAVPLYTQKYTEGAGCGSLPLVTSTSTNHWVPVPPTKGPSPFVEPNLVNGKVLLGTLDTTFLICYAAGLFVAGHIGDHVNLRWFLAMGMIGSGIFVASQGMAYFWNIHVFGYFVGMYAIQGLFQAIGWPSVVAVLGSWFGHRTRGLAMGIWNAHTSCGNILGSIVSTAALQFGSMHGGNWPMAFIFCGSIIFVMGCVIAVCLTAHPHRVGLASPNDDHVVAAEAAKALRQEQKKTAVAAADGDELGDRASDDAATPAVPPPAEGSGGTHVHAGDPWLAVTRMTSGVGTPAIHDPVTCIPAPVDESDAAESEADEAKEKSPRRGNCASFIRALCIPGVVEFAFALFFCKLVAYTFIYWLPLYLTHISYTTTEAGYLSTFFDLGGILGGVTAGYVSDRVGMRGVVAVVFLLAAVPGLYFYRVLTKEIGDSSTSLNVLFMLVCGAIVNGPYALITTAVSADLGTHKSLKNDSKLLASVTGIIDGTGSIGAACQGVLISYISSNYSWTAVFYALIGCSCFSALLLTRVVIKEIRGSCRLCRRKRRAAADERTRLISS